MSGFVCPKCNGESQIFKPSTGGAKKLAEEMDVELLGCVPLDPRIGKSADYGVSFLDEYPDSPASTAYLDIIDSESTLFSFEWLCGVYECLLALPLGNRNKRNSR